MRPAERLISILNSHFSPLNSQFKTRDMTKEYEQRKSDGPERMWYHILNTVVRICLFIVAILFLLMVIFPKGLWLEMFN